MENQEGFIETEVVDRDLPLLYSKEAMKKASVIIDFVEDKATVNGEEISLETTSSEHYTIP